ncbi:MAG: type II secretion system protein [Chthoniobacteraceae bacterium]|nr:type II secretion system protein [Chthoniobacteraceae bacterium]
MKLPRPPKGFTLIELLVVISIIAVLASLAVPAVTGALVKGQLIQAVNNVRQIHMATMSMSTDGAANSDSSLGWPGDLKDNSQIATLPAFVTRLAVYDYLKPGDLKVFSAAGVNAYTSGTLSGSGTSATLNPSFNTYSASNANSAYKVHCVRDTDPSTTVFLSTKNYTYNTAITDTTIKPFGDKGFVICRKGGDASYYKSQQAQSINLIGSITKSQTSEEILP